MFVSSRTPLLAMPGRALRRTAAIAFVAVALAAAVPTRAGATEPAELVEAVVNVVRSFRCMVVTPQPMFIWVCWFN